MKKIFLLLSLILLPTMAIAQDYKILRVIDGDTVEIEAPFLPPPLKNVLHLRVLGVDTPEKGFRAKCSSERDLAEKASNFTKDQVAKAKVIKVEVKKWDKYGGRVLGDIYLDGESLSKKLINAGFAVEYFGATKPSWCK